MNSSVQLDAEDSIQLQAKVLDKLGHIYLSQLYGSYEKSFDTVEDIEGSVAEFSCPHCHHAFPVFGACKCKAPIIGFALEIGGTIKICTRNGCKQHSLEFENVDDAFFLFRSQDDTHLS